MSSSSAQYTPLLSAIKCAYRGVTPEKLGTTEVVLPDGTAYLIRDLQYDLGDAQLGWRIIPVEDPPSNSICFSNRNCLDTFGHIDDFLRSKSGLSENDPIYAIITYLHPEEHKCCATEIHNTYKLKLGHTHTGAYLGRGYTTHSPENYHVAAWSERGHNIWNVKGYPANIHLISLQGVSQRELNRNAVIVDSLLSSGVKAPVKFDNLRCRPFTLPICLQFYRDWLVGADYLREYSWWTNCSVHKMIVINVLLNLPHNRSAFVEIFGDGGHELWRIFRARFRAIHGRELTDQDETRFTPLWKVEGLLPEQVRPLSAPDYFEWDAANLEHRSQQRPMKVSLEAGMAWRLENIVDVVGAFINMYLPFVDAGGLVPASELIALSATAEERMGCSTKTFLSVTEPIVLRLLIADALLNNCRLDEWFAKSEAQLLGAFNKSEPDLTVYGPQPLVVVARYLDLVRAELSHSPELASLSRAGVLQWLVKAIRHAQDEIAQQIENGRDDVGFLVTPSIFHKIDRGFHLCNRFVTIRTVCTVMDVSEIDIDAATKASQLGINRVASSNSSAVDAHVQHVPNETQNNNSLTQSSCSCQSGRRQLVYALGKLGYDFSGDARRDSIRQKMIGRKIGDNPEDAVQFEAYLEREPWDAASVNWLLLVDSNPIYVIRPSGAYAAEGYRLLRQFLKEQRTERVERISVPGLLSGKATLSSGWTIPVIEPDLRGFYSWTTAALIDALLGKQPSDSKEQDAFHEKRRGIENFLSRVYYEVRNVGISPQERAINFAATNAFELERVYEDAIKEEMDLDSIDVKRSPICRPESDCWDVMLNFFFPQRQVQTVRKVYRFTVDVSDVVPVTVGDLRSWFVR